MSTIDVEIKVIVDIWGGHNSCDHVARFYLPTQQALQRAEAELASGFLVNLRVEAAFGPEENWDSRSVGGIQ